MQNFLTQINNIVGFTVADGTDIDDHCTASAKEVLDILPDSMLLRHSTGASTSSYYLSVTNKRVLHVEKSDGSVTRNCMQIPVALKGRSTDSNSIHKATSFSPIYWIEDDKVHIEPQSGTQGVVYNITYPTIDAGTDTDISNFPDTAEHAVVLSASLKVLNDKLGALIVTDEDTELAQTLQGLIASTSALYQKEIQRLTGAKS